MAKLAATATVKTFQYDHLPIDDVGAGVRAASSANFRYIPSVHREPFLIRIAGAGIEPTDVCEPSSGIRLTASFRGKPLRRQGARILRMVRYETMRV